MIEKWSENNGISINKAKSGIICLRADRRTSNPITIEYRDYPIVDKYEYLGVLIDNCIDQEVEHMSKHQIE